MPITFEEVSAEIQRDPQASGPSGAPAPKAATPGEDIHEQIERDLRLMAERRARICAD